MVHIPCHRACGIDQKNQYPVLSARHGMRHVGINHNPLTHGLSLALKRHSQIIREGNNDVLCEMLVYGRLLVFCV